MRNDQLQEYLKQFTPDSEIRVLIDGVYYNVEDVIQGRFFATVELVGPQTLSIEQAEGELYSGYFYDQLNPKREALIVKVLGQDRVDYIKREVDKAKSAKQAAEQAVVMEDTGFIDEIEEVEVKKPKKKKSKKKLSVEEKLLLHFKGEEELEVEEIQEIRKALGAEKVREIFNKASE